MVLAIIQARMGSTRLPGKVLIDLEGKPVIERVVDRVLMAKKVDKVVVATSIDQNNLPLVELCAKKKIQVFVGSEDDVLDRFYQAAKLFNPDHVVRITADCPLMDPAVIDLVIDEHLNNGHDYTSNTFSETYPDGEDVEVFKYSALEKAWSNATLTSEREHVTPYIRKHNDIFTHGSVSYTQNLSQKRWTLDNQEDLEFISKVYKALYKSNPLFGIDMILDYLKEHPELEMINNHIMRNEGYAKSLVNDKQL